jgi:hypothetical protein
MTTTAKIITMPPILAPNQLLTLMRKLSWISPPMIQPPPTHAAPIAIAKSIRFTLDKFDDFKPVYLLQ